MLNTSIDIVDPLEVIMLISKREFNESRRIHENNNIKEAQQQQQQNCIELSE